MIEWSLDAFRASDPVRSIVVAVPPTHPADAVQLGSSSQPADIRQVGPQAGSTPVAVVQGGATRAVSVSNALRVVDTELVAIHDAARPLLTSALVEALVAALDAAPDAAGSIAATPVTDTVKRTGSGSKAAFQSDSDGNAALVIEGTVDRSALWAAQTPQVFRTEALRGALAAAERPEEATDEAMLVEAAGGTVLIHPAGPENLKVTTRLDLRVAEMLLAERGF
jgi:2-C-methyl-D-erythritol 4-phosphate cytidylyltransferase